MTIVDRMHEADLKRAKEILKKIEKAGDLAREAREVLKEASGMAGNDSYQGVKIYDRKDIDDVESVLRVAVTKPINLLIPRWIEIVHGREKPFS